MATNTVSQAPRGTSTGVLDLIERLGNHLPDPATLFVLGTLAVMLVSGLATAAGWNVHGELPQPVADEVVLPDGTTVSRPRLDATGEPVIEWKPTGTTYEPKSLLTRDGLFWAARSMVENFTAFPPLGVVLVGMLGIGIAERTGFISAALRTVMLVTPGALLTPAVLFVGVMSSLTLDGGYVVLPPLAAVLYRSVGRSPVTGLAVVFAGVSAGFGANLFITGLDPMLAGFTSEGAQVIEPDYAVNPAANWWFMAASTIVVTLVGWAVTELLVEPRFRNKPPEQGGPFATTNADVEAHRLAPEERKALRIAGAAGAITLASFALMIAPEWGFLNGPGVRFERWIEALVPMILVGFAVPGIVFGIATKRIRNDKQVAALLVESMAAMAPIVVLAFFAAQFIAAFNYSNLDEMLAMAGGQILGKAGLSAGPLIVAFILLTVIFNLFIGSMSAKYALFAPIFIPMFMMVNISPELTQAAYRIGDSVSNIVTPLNSYLVIILAVMRKYAPQGGIGTLISTMLPYSIALTIVWTVMLLVWMLLGIPLGPDGGLTYTPID